MIRQRVSKNGRIYALQPADEIAALQLPAARIGAINPALVKKWLDGKTEWDAKFAAAKLRMQKQRLEELVHSSSSDGGFAGESPPVSALAARRGVPGAMAEKGRKMSYGMLVWSRLASKHDRRTVEREMRRPSASRLVSDTGQAAT